MTEQNTKNNKITTVTRPFLKKETGLINKTEEPVTELKEYVLALMKNNGYTDFIEGIQPGEFYLKSADGKQEKSILLTPNKLTTIVYNNQYIKGWIAHEDNMSPYPEDPIHNGEMYRKTTQKLAMNYKDANDAKYLEAQTKQKMIYVLGGLLVIYILYIIGKKSGWFTNTPPPTPQTVKTVVEVVKQNLTNTGVNIG